jgi:ATP-binding cassette, subfamily B, bacterial
LIAASSVAQGVVPVSYALLTRIVLNSLIAHQSTTTVLGVVGLAITSGVLLILAPVTNYATAELNRKLEISIQSGLAAAIANLRDLHLLDSPAYRDRLRLAQQAGLNAPAQVVTGCLAVAQSAITLVGFVLTLVTLDPWIAVLVVGSGVPAMFAELRLGSSRARMYLHVSPFRRRILGFTSLLVDPNAAQEVQAFGLGGLLRSRLLGALDRAIQAERMQDRREVATRIVLGCVAAAAGAASLALVVIGTLGRQFNVGDVAIVLAALGTLQLTLSGVIAQFGQMTTALRVLDHYREVVDLANESQPSLHPPVQASRSPIAHLRKGIELRHLWFRYDDTHPWVLEDVNLFLPFNASCALVGPNGSGKTTIVKLLCRLYDPTRGAVLWDGVDVREFPVIALRRLISLVLQDPVIYDLSAAENIGVGNVDSLADREATRAAATLAGVDDVLSRLPHGYDTHLSRMFDDDAVGHAGVKLSAGQAQRVAIARAFMRTEADLVILDEPSSSLDARAEQLVHQRLNQLRGNRASLLISHRMSAARTAGQIAVLDCGRVVEAGTHEELLQAHGTYADLFLLQAAGYADLAFPFRSA